MTIYRIQDKDGRGPFRQGLSAQWLDSEPEPNEDALKAWIEEFPDIAFFIRICRVIYCGCGCESPEQLRIWFSKSEMDRLKALGFQAVTMDVEEVLAQSAVQLVFRRLAPLRENVEAFELYPA